MPDDITPAQGATPPASPAPAGNPGNPPVTPETPKDGGTPPKSEKVSNATHARLRIAERALKQRQATEKQTPPPDDDLDPSEEEVVKKVLDKNGYGNLQKDISDIRSESDTRAIREEVDNVIKDSVYGEFLTPDEKDKVHKLSLDDKYVNLSIDELITLSISGRMTEIGADLSKKASAKIKDSKIPTSGSSMGVPKKTALEMTDAEWAQERAKQGFSS